MTVVQHPQVVINEAAEVSRECQEYLAGRGPDVQGVVLMDLVSLWVAGHNPELRAEIVHEWFNSMLDLVPMAEQELLQRYPNGWTRQ